MPRTFGPSAELRCVKILAYVIEYKRDHDGIAPTLREIGAAVGIGSTFMINFYLTRLVDRGAIRYNGSPRSIEVIGGKWSAPQMEAHP